MKILLLNASFNRFGGVPGHGGSQIPLNLCCLAAYVRREQPDWQMRILDAEAQKLSHEQTVQESASWQPDLIGITTNTCVFDSVMLLVEMLKDRLPKVPVALGGPHPSALPEDTLRCCQADFLILGEGERTFLELLQQLECGNDQWSEIDGLAWRDSAGQQRVNRARGLIQDLDNLPLPARDLVDNALYYPPPTKRVADGPSTLVSTSRGCPCNCRFCSAQNVWSRRIRFRSAASVVEELQQCVEEYGIRSFNFADEFFTASKPRVLEICHTIKRRDLDIRWVVSARAQKLDQETLNAMYDAGCREISFGIESGNPEILKRMDKRIDLDEAEHVIRRSKRAGLVTHAGYIIGYPGETEQTVQDTIRTAERFNTDIAAFWIASPLPGTPLAREAKANGWLRQGAKWADYSPLSNNPPVLSLPNLPPWRVRQLHRYALRRYYLRPEYIARRLLSLRHWYQVKNIAHGLLTLLRIRS